MQRNDLQQAESQQPFLTVTSLSDSILPGSAQQVLISSPADATPSDLDSMERGVHPVLDSVTLRADFETNAPLPTPLACVDAPRIGFSISTSTINCVLYALGGSLHGVNYLVGGIAANFPQGIMYGLGTWDFFKYSYYNFNEMKGRAILASIIGVGVVLPATFAAIDVGNKTFGAGSNWVYALMAGTFIGSLPNLIYGTCEALNRPVEWYYDKPEIRKVALEQYRITLPESLQAHLQKEHSTAQTALSYTLGIGNGVALMGSQLGYVCNTSNFLRKNSFGLVGGLTLGIFVNSPLLFMALAISGVDLAKDAVELTSAVYHHIKGDKKILLTSDDKKLLAAFLLTLASFSYYCYHSSGTSQTLYDGDCPEYFNDSAMRMYDPSLIRGASLFNGILTGKSLYKFWEFVFKSRPSTADNAEVFKSASNRPLHPYSFYPHDRKDTQTAFAVR